GLGGAGQGDLAQAGLEGHGGEGGDGRAVGLSVAVRAGDDGNAAGELSEDVAECALIHVCVLLSGASWDGLRFDVTQTIWTPWNLCDPVSAVTIHLAR